MQVLWTRPGLIDLASLWAAGASAHHTARRFWWRGLRLAQTRDRSRGSYAIQRNPRHQALGESPPKPIESHPSMTRAIFDPPGCTWNDHALDIGCTFLLALRPSCQLGEHH
jgi:hypothetical protein